MNGIATQKSIFEYAALCKMINIDREVKRGLSSFIFLYQSCTWHFVVKTVRKKLFALFCKNAWFFGIEFLMNNFVTKYIFLHNSCSHKIHFCHFLSLLFRWTISLDVIFTYINYPLLWSFHTMHKMPML